jgi:hypothetical protein
MAVGMLLASNTRGAVVLWNLQSALETTDSSSVRHVAQLQVQQSGVNGLVVEHVDQGQAPFETITGGLFD